MASMAHAPTRAAAARPVHRQRHAVGAALLLTVLSRLTYAIYAEFVATDHFPFNPRVTTPTIYVHVAG